MSDQASNDRAQAVMRQRQTPLNNDGGAGQKICSPRQAPETKRPTNHVDPSTGKRS